MKRQSRATTMFAPIKRELELVEKKWQTFLREENHPAIDEIKGFLRGASGKRLRPALAILSAGAVLGEIPRNIQAHLTNVALGIELLHVASLIHDDTIDSASIRHNKPTINAKFGPHVAVAFGDYVYCWALKLISVVSDPAIFQLFAQRAFELCEGELVQILERKSLTMTPANYFSIVKRKTAALYALAGEAGALVANSNFNADSNTVANDKLISEGVSDVRESGKARAMREFGLNFGMAFQIADDLQDLVGTHAELGKEPGADFHAAELTLPIILLLQDAKAGEEVKRLLNAKNKKAAFETLKRIAEGSDALKKTRAKAHYFLRKARGSVSSFDESPYKEQLMALVEWLAAKTA